MWFYCLYSWRWFTEPILSLCTLLFTFQSTLKLEAIVQNIKSKFLYIRILLLQRPDENQGVLITINIFFFCILSPQNLEHFAYSREIQTNLTWYCLWFEMYYRQVTRDPFLASSSNPKYPKYEKYWLNYRRSCFLDNFEVFLLENKKK